MAHSRHRPKQHRRSQALKPDERAIEHGRRRAKLKAQLVKDPESVTKTERRYERWDKWTWD